MDLQNQNKDTAPLLVRFRRQPKPVAQNDDLKAPKVRKPYTITKQREKWTDEEHHKFLEALKLYGRAWRQIEESIGTKTAVQIRSHAQKFFSKVVRGGDDSTESPVQVIEIPPPRPKRKPAHPYPRKFVEPQNSISPSFQPEKRLCSPIVASDTENQSPNSVLSAAVTHMLEFPVSELPDSCLSTSSCSNGLQSGSLFSVDKEDNTKAISSFQYKENEIVPTTNRSASSKMHNPVSKGTVSFEKEADLPEAAIMLFGKIVYTKDSKRAFSDKKDTFKSSAQHLTNDNDDKHGKTEESPASNGLDTPLSHRLYYGNWMPWGLHEISSDSREASTHVSMQWMPLPLYSGTLPLYLMPCRRSSGGPLTDDGKEPFISRMKSDSTHLSSVGGDAASPIHNHKSGFVPYRRCFGTGSIKSAKTVAEEDDGQRFQLCL